MRVNLEEAAADDTWTRYLNTMFDELLGDDNSERH